MDETTRPRLTPTIAVLLIGAPVLMAVGRLLLVPFNDQGWDAQLTEAAAHQSRSDAGWLIAMAASGLLGAAALALAWVLHVAGRTRAAAFTAVTTALGWAGSAGICAGGILLSYQGKAPDRAVQVQLLRDFNSGHSAFIFLLCVVAAIGYVVLAVELVRSGLVGKGVAILIGVGGVGTLLTMPGPMKSLLVLAALVLLAGQALAVRAVGVTTTTDSKPVWESVSP
ncbi:MAG: hypothetical protein ABJA93_08665 [Sporichthyaceae bacterium]